MNTQEYTHPNEITLSGREGDTEQVKDSIKRIFGSHNKIVAFSGGADYNLEGISDKTLQDNYKKVMQTKEEHIIKKAIHILKDYNVVILSGGTKWGVPKTAATEAKKYGLKTIGIYPSRGRKHALGEDILDLAICVEPYYGESEWGDESPIFAQFLDAVIVYAGGAGTLIEIAHTLKINEDIVKKKKQEYEIGDSEDISADKRITTKYIVPISGTGGVADGLPFIWSKTEVRNASMPRQRVSGGKEAANILIDRLNLDYQ
ncbi:hypothetical protein [Candidatus Parabeggiatoa sp. HSG14]|uniref:SLOG cluster 4 domain-containing protein n=1 Tax=Candidatus Parabeggiatoa sp. HSG14 TaxID=3055593 RepID=UPI0025A8C297|nr:hypothetical protein [Thiotrichales bacterium HSG14]